MLNTSSEPVPLPAGEVLLSSTDVLDGLLPPDSAVWVA
jgi:alpha-glucosidase